MDENSSLISAYFNPSSENNLQVTQITLFQLGDYNTIDIRTSTKENVQVLQQGEYNSYFFISAYGDKDFNIGVLQQGQNNNIQVYGENSLMKDATIRQTGSDKQIIITNNWSLPKTSRSPAKPKPGAVLNHLVENSQTHNNLIFNSKRGFFPFTRMFFLPTFVLYLKHVAMLKTNFFKNLRSIYYYSSTYPTSFKNNFS